ncbi:MAG: hypothetical protein QOJ85_4196 [Solirubrobacteraceae bacterium]|jgi:hypothetical protein|nr:hypothetical protein [Solirubrobacteraceae bacterium]MEA2240499.1 hypothetical protein [Solirubrobacteraceae bacterium]
MQIAVKPRRIAAGTALLGLLMAVVLTIPGPASAATFGCSGHINPGTVSDDYENPIDYKFACAGRIVSYMIVTDREIDAFDTEIEVHDPAGVIIPADGFACEGDFPGFGVGCLGTYGANGVVTGTVSLSQRKPCDEPRVDVKLIVVAESLDASTGKPLKTSTGAMAGPFDLGRPRSCPKSSVLGGLLAEIAQMRADIRGATKS